MNIKSVHRIDLIDVTGAIKIIMDVKTIYDEAIIIYFSDRILRYSIDGFGYIDNISCYYYDNKFRREIGFNNKGLSSDFLICKSLGGLEYEGEYIDYESSDLLSFKMIKANFLTKIRDIEKISTKSKKGKMEINEFYEKYT